MITGGTLPLQALRERGFTDDKIREMGGNIQGLNVVFTDRIGGFDNLGEIIKLPTKKSGEEMMKIKGPPLWAELHQWALLDKNNPVVRGIWLVGFARKVPCGKCRRHWKEIIADIPPLLGSNEELFAWTVEVHNRVNTVLNKPTITLEEARRIWQETPAPSPNEQQP